MTLIACTVTKNIPFLIGDILFSSKAGREIMQLPTNNFDINVYLPKNTTTKPDSLSQKIYIIRDNLCIILAGLEAEMKDLLVSFKKWCNIYFASEVINETHIIEFFEHYDFQSSFLKSHFGIILVDRVDDNLLNTKFITNNGWGLLNTDIFDDVHACGSGQESFLSIVKELGNFKSGLNKEDLMSIIQSNISLVAKILTLEKITLHTLMDHWGAGFETVFYNNDRFEKMDKIAYIISVGDFDDEGNIGVPIPRSILYYQYHNDILFITAIEVLKSKKVNYEDKIIITSILGEYDVNLHIVPSIERVDILSDSDYPADYSFNTFKISMGYCLLHNKINPFYPSYFSFHPEATVAYEHGKSIEIKIPKVYNDDIAMNSKNEFINTMKGHTEGK